MAPKFSQSAVARMPHLQLLEAAQELGVVFPKGSLDLEMRAMVVRKIVGGAPVLGSEKTAGRSNKNRKCVSKVVL